MSAGLLTYQLCDRDFDCANCPLDRAMRNMVKEGEQGDGHRIPLRVDPLRMGRYYTQEHCWISIRSADTVRIGLDPNLAERCKGLVGISLPTVGREVLARNPVVWIRFVQGMIPVRLPLDIRVIGVNRHVSEEPVLVVNDPYDAGWLLEARIDRDQLEACRLMTSWMAEKSYSHDEQQFLSQVRDAGGMVPKQIGVTAYDGGAPVRDLPGALGSGHYCTLVSQVYCKT
jgi:glycine cleavage system H protein